jgi:hypothetical protein
VKATVNYAGQVSNFKPSTKSCQSHKALPVTEDAQALAGKQRKQVRQVLFAGS